MDILAIIKKYYKPETKAYYILVNHSKAVTKKAVEIAKNLKHLNPDLKFIKEAAMLHDVGIVMTNFPQIGCFGDKPYLYHGYLGRKILEKEGYPKHALVCERHIGVGLTREDIKELKLKIPKRDMIPISLEEEIICFADKFFSKKDKHLFKEKNINQIRKELSEFGKYKAKKFDKLAKKLKY
ncbi:MAG: HDIG domain-containing protein [Candidatus Nanoarchaeia archaeon]|nr:HDIG domain-containing protein [Candidatus Nanoarchaeia archaeon]